MSIWPGEAKLTAPLFCSAPYREPVVVSDTFHDSEGTSVNYTLYCVTDRGAVTDEGFILPFLVLMAVHIAIITAVAFLTGLWIRRRPLRGTQAVRPRSRPQHPRTRQIHEH
ncbi:hypothetical protein AB0E01_37945 [Nocardia vinacea]|uniref:hypothetical protein n=1 Tax=Nocardia vinacea TaxID=96468 RepID=UPI0033E2919D